MIFLNCELSKTRRNGNPKMGENHIFRRLRRFPMQKLVCLQLVKQHLLFQQKIHDQFQDTFVVSMTLPMVYPAQTECNMCWWMLPGPSVTIIMLERSKEGLWLYRGREYVPTRQCRRSPTLCDWWNSTRMAKQKGQILSHAWPWRATHWSQVITSMLHVIQWR